MAKPSQNLTQALQISACLRDLMKRKRWGWFDLGVRVGTKEKKRVEQITHAKSPAFGCARDRLKILMLLESEGYDVLDFYTCPISEQKWRAQPTVYGLWPRSRDSFEKYVLGQGLELKSPREVLRGS